MRRKGENLGKAVYLGIVAGMLVSLVLILLAAVLMAMGIGSENPAKLFSGIQYFAAAWAGAVSGRKSKRRGYLVGGITGLLWSLLLYGLSSIVGAVSLGDWWGKIGFCFLLGAAGGIWGVNRD
ncbi:MAG: TIGR04086 family membrane protein [Firmicutes bacterium]|jgi:putative membrane protein (TIGR04086 family)|nr:TIGR04086 family membrane protein [Bacillota bacterium]HOB22267.1 TIGR04086 family membrane protein [Bacillota bacterium]HQD40715.1 TIGR04086 family membrane protein [Bacillota bacterium]